jgi:SAM-dependent methyltransferase
MTFDQFSEVLAQKGLVKRATNLRNFIKDYLFLEIQLAGKSLIDVGGGDGRYGLCAVLIGAKRAVVLEPEAAGSSVGFTAFKNLHSLAGSPPQCEFEQVTLAEYTKTKGGQEFDIVLLHNVINHLDEEACITLHQQEASRERYRQQLREVAAVCSPGGTLIICDCSRKSFWPAVGLRNPFMEWHKHQTPELWAALLQDIGFSQAKVRWTTPNSLGAIGRLFLSNRLASYFMFSHFRLEMQKSAAA